ncbi:DUF4097 domain-containing protein [Metabacillus litoralis]|uniref:DUF4097 family beta strand repeat-containing protein n=1 Tax=Metabacillus litoralis TaxID=152268 RepID=UPI001E639A0F|nr:DUF4097 family beta strand repeat-containing protein [Metabacillus litoralis]UHA59715.1 DUF4097 domain-containing protein [Metabacillus litoralis]
MFLIIHSNTTWFVFGGNGSSAEVSNKVDKIELDISGASTKIIPEKTDQVRAELKGKGKVVVTENGDTINVESKSQKWFHLFSMFNKTEITIYIPEDYEKELIIDSGSGNVSFNGHSKMKLDSLMIDMSSGNVQISKLTAHELELDGSSGNVNLSSISTKSGIFDMSSGNLTIKEHTGKVEADLSSGKINLEMNKLIDSIDVEINSGLATINLPSNADFTLNGSIGSGHISTDFDLKELQKNSEGMFGVYGSGKHQVNIDVSSGKVEIN